MTERLDKFLFFVRFARTRKAAQEFIEKSRPRINHQPTTKPHMLVREGDVLTLALGHTIRVIRIKALPQRRMSPSGASAFFDDLDPPIKRSASDHTP